MDNPHNLRRRLARTVPQPPLLLPRLLATRTVVDTVCHHSPLLDHQLEQPLQHRILTVVSWFPPVLLRQPTIRLVVGTECHQQHPHNLQQRLPTHTVPRLLCCHSQKSNSSFSKHPTRMVMCMVRLLHSRRRLQQILDSERWCLLNSLHRHTLERHHRSSNSNKHPCLPLIHSRSSTLHQRLPHNLLHRHRRHLHRMPWSQQLLLPRVVVVVVTFGAI
mmetsp:Transcript_29751/g.72041  ORF Transcript_29751/g.72041 Transcript_29751/m.72041 type:complete len:218 (-) Transcript_29751:1178-1831(-)